jgi:hypothetical protein
MKRLTHDGPSPNSGNGGIGRREMVSGITGMTAAAAILPSSHLPKPGLAFRQINDSGTRTLPPMSLSLIGALSSLRFSTQDAQSTFKRILSTLQPHQRRPILIAFDSLMSTAVAATQGASSDDIWTALFHLNDVINQANLDPLLGPAIFGAASGIFCSLVCDPIAGYILKDWFVSDFEFRFDTTRVAVTCIYTCPKMT